MVAADKYAALVYSSPNQCCKYICALPTVILATRQLHCLLGDGRWNGANHNVAPVPKAQLCAFVGHLLAATSIASIPSALLDHHQPGSKVHALNNPLSNISIRKVVGLDNHALYLVAFKKVESILLLYNDVTLCLPSVLHLFEILRCELETVDSIEAYLVKKCIPFQTVIERSRQIFPPPTNHTAMAERAWSAPSGLQARCQRLSNLQALL